MSVGSIYKIEFPNGKHYIGLTSRSLEDRKKEHKWSVKSGNYNNLVYRALTKYEMVDTFELVEIDTADTLEELCEKEIRYIQHYKSYYMDGNGYNMTLGGEGFNGYIRTEEDNRKSSERRKQYFEDNPEARETCSKAQKKRFENPEEKEKMKKISQDFWNNTESKKKMSEIRLISQSTPQAKQNMSKAQKKRFENPEAGKEHGEKMKKMYEANPMLREQMSEAMKKYYKNNPDAIQKISETQIQYNKEHPEAGKEHGEKMKKMYEANPMLREQMSEAKKIYYLENPEAGKEHGEKMKQYYIDNPEEKEKMREIGKALWKRAEHKTKILDARGKNKPFDVSKIDGTFVKTFNYQYEAREYLQKEHNITSTIKIGAVLNGNRTSSAGFVFKYQE